MFPSLGLILPTPAFQITCQACLFSITFHMFKTMLLFTNISASSNKGICQIKLVIVTEYFNILIFNLTLTTEWGIIKSFTEVFYFLYISISFDLYILELSQKFKKKVGSFFVNQNHGRDFEPQKMKEWDYFGKVPLPQLKQSTERNEIEPQEHGLSQGHSSCLAAVT